MRNYFLNMLKAFLLIGTLSAAHTSYAALCDGTKPRVSINPRQGHDALVLWMYDGPRDCTDAYNLRYAIIGQPEQQIEVGGAWCPTQGNNNKSCIHQMALVADKPYLFKVQACHTRFLQSSTCSQWGETRLLPHGPGSCIDGFVWREAFANDHVCVRPATRDLVRQQNAQAASHVSSTDHAFGPDTCVQGFVWREATPADHVCVAPADRQMARDDNAQASNRTIH